MKIATHSLLITFLAFGLAGWLTPSSLVYAQRFERVLTVKSGLQYEGALSSAAEMVEGGGGINPYETQPIVRIDDGLRQIFVSFNRVARVGESSRNEIEIPIFQRPYPGSEGGGSIVYMGPFNEHGHRVLIVRAANLPDPITYVQGITLVTPRFCEVQTLVGAEDKPKQWAMTIGTGTVPTEVLRGLMRRQIKDPERPAEYLQIAEFFLQAERYQDAIDELRFIQSQFPELKERIQDDHAQIRQAFARQVLREIRMRMDSGQTQLATAFARVFNKEGVAGELLAEFRDIERQAENEADNIRQRKTKIKNLIVSLDKTDQFQNKAIERFQREIESELNQVNAPRLDAFLRLADDKTMPAQQKLALAISGWLLGSNDAIENLAVVQDMFDVRDLVIEYFRSDDVIQREQILKQLAEFESGSPKFLAPMIREMKPPMAPDLSAHTGETPFEFTVEIPGPKIDPEPQLVRCLVQLPPEYDPYRRYPMVVTLPGGRQTAEQNLAMWCGPYHSNLKIRTGHASRNGYIVLAVDWRLPGQSAYQYSAREHALVMKALRGALRRFSVDTDRVFLSGHGIGGEAAYDIGISHPEHWAGVISVSGKMGKYVDIYAKNKHVDFPVYSVVGSKDFPTFSANKDTWNTWLPSKRYANCTIVAYQGRANELFPEEIPEMFKWMRAQRRRLPDKSGFSFECKTLRPWDTYFWFLEFHGIPVENVVWPEAWRTTKMPRLVIEGKNHPENPNQFRIGPASTRIGNDATLWLSPEFVNFENRIVIEGRGKDFAGFVKPSTRVLLEDVRRRADRLHPYWARIDCRNFIWQPSE